MMAGIESIVTNVQADRQVRIWGPKNQKKIDDSRVIVVGSGPLSQMVVSNLAGLGIGYICLMDNSRISRQDLNEFLCFRDINNMSNIGARKVDDIGMVIKTLNPSIEFVTRFSKFTEPFAYQCNPKIIIDATNDPISKESCLYYAVSYRIPYISASSNFSKGTLSCYVPDKRKKRQLDFPDFEKYLNGEYKGEIQGSFSSGVIAGLVTDETRKLLFSIADYSIDNPIPNNRQITYNLNSKKRTGAESDFKEPHLNYFRDNSALVVGAGAVGNFAALNLALLGVGNIDIIDFDYVDITNLNRQILFYDKVGEPKAKVLSERIKKINSGIKGSYYVEKFSPNLVSGKKYDMIFSCVDKNSARLEVNEYSVRQKIPSVESGCSPTAGKLSLYIPGKTPCIDCQNNLYLHIEKEKESESTGCAQEPSPSVVVPNIIMGSFMAGEFVNMLYHSTRTVLDKSLAFNSLSENKIGFEKYIVSKKECECRRKL